uniref:SRCR domain-containing protein n=1 Tax=Mesocestoides corti TaxID=53468 RepID=A0A5K3FXS9_MESCO
MRQQGARTNLCAKWRWHWSTMTRSVEWSCKESGHDVGPDVFGRAVVDLGVGEEVAEGKEKEEGEECVGVAVGTAAEPGATSDMSSSDAKWLIYAHSLC